MNSEKSIFISRVSALQACIRVGRQRGLTDECIAKEGNAFPVYQRGELKGFHALIPADPLSKVRTHIMEGEL